MRKILLPLLLILIIGLNSCKKDNPIDIDNKTTTSRDSINNSYLLAYYNFDNNNAKDYSGNNYNAELKNNISFVNGIKGKAAHLIGSYISNDLGGYILLPSINFNNFKEFTISMWVNEDSTSLMDGEAYLFYGDHYTGWLGIMNHAIPEIDSHKRIQFASGGHVIDNTHYTNAINLYFPESTWKNQWVHYALTYNNGLLTAYRNNIVVGSLIQPVYFSRNNGAIGRHWYSVETSSRLTADIDEVRIYSIALSNIGISNLFAEKK